MMVPFVFLFSGILYFQDFTPLEASVTAYEKGFELIDIDKYAGTRPDTLWQETGFQPLISNKEKRGNHVWFRLALYNSSESTDTAYLFLSPTPIWLYTFKLEQNGNISPLDTAGTWQVPERVQFSQFPEITALPLLPKEKATFIIKANVLRVNPNRVNLVVKDKLSTYQEFYEKDYQAEFVRVIHTISMGLITFAAIFFFAYALINRQRLYFIYLLYILSSWFFSLQFWAHIPFVSYGYFHGLVYLKHYTFEASTIWMYIFYILFIKDLLEIKKQNPRLSKTLNGLCWALLFYSLLFMFFNITGINDKWIPILYNWFRILVMPFYVGLLLYIIATIKSPVKKYFTMAASVLLIGTFLAVIVAMFFERSIEIGKTVINDGDILVITIFIEITLNAMILAYYNAVTKRESLRNQELYIKQLEENRKLVQEESIRLEKLVDEAKAAFKKEQEIKERQRMALVQAAFENRIQNLKLQTLESQMDPHFIFNAMSAFRDLILKNSEKKAINYINAFATLLRKTLSYNKLHAIDLFEELKITELYLEIEKLRFQDDFNYHIYVDKGLNLDPIQVPPRILQPIVENAIKHGLLPSLKNVKTIGIHITRESETIKIIIKDNGIGYLNGMKMKLKKEPARKSFGLDLIQERLNIFNQQFEHQISFRIEQIELSEEDFETIAIFSIKNS
ncbi:histidine kinase [Fontibacter flavus]|uniref:Histidine kinase n=1 Tax=Fontibacter flavus TaxID=654838 RepID=A0ABV6FUV5_9BACT|nr:histidine kinase [Cyclobacteriaceae bacterium]